MVFLKKKKKKQQQKQNYSFQLFDNSKSSKDSKENIQEVKEPTTFLFKTMYEPKVPALGCSAHPRVTPEGLFSAAFARTGAQTPQSTWAGKAASF